MAEKKGAVESGCCREIQSWSGTVRNFSTGIRADKEYVLSVSFGPRFKL